MILFFVCVCCILFNFIRALTHHNLVINFKLLLQNYLKLLNLKKNSSALKKILQRFSFMHDDLIWTQKSMLLLKYIRSIKSGGMWKVREEKPTTREKNERKCGGLNVREFI